MTALAAALAWPGAVASARPTFTDVTAAAGVAYLQHSPAGPPDCLLFGGLLCEPERMSGGAAAGDADGDGDLDLFVTRLDAPDLLFCNRLVETGSATFEDCSAAAGLDVFDLQSNGAAWGDIDRDGDLDLYVTTIGAGDDPVNSRFYLFVNDGSGHFSEEAIGRGAALASPVDRAGYSATFGDYDGDGWLDLHVNEWVPTSRGTLLRNRAHHAPGAFEDVTEAAGLVPDPEACVSGTGPCRIDAFASTLVDLDDDGCSDLAVAADFETSRLYWSNCDGTFTDGTQAAGVGTDENGMGSTFGDFDGDGDLDWFVTSIHDPDETCETFNCNWGYTGNRLYRNEGGRSFVDATDAAGVREGFWGWGAVFFDADNDGDLDLVMTNGVDFPNAAVDQAFNADPMRFWENDGTGAFTEVSASVGITDTGSGKGLLVFDYDDDGDLDLFVVNNADSPVLYRNDGGNAGDWLRVELQGSRSNRHGIGARITLWPAPGAAKQVREVGVSSHFLGQSESVAHFGLGTGRRPVALVSVVWPSGQTQLLWNVPRNTTLRAMEPAGRA
jgi:hypothetical protein